MKDIDFVARHYKAGRFSVEKGWRRLGIGPSMRWRRLRVAAAVAAVVVLGATAAIVYHQIQTPAPAAVEVQAPEAGALTAVRVIDFDDAPLSQVVTNIEDVYGVRVTGLPAEPDAYRLSLHYEGTAVDLVDTINDILGTDMSVEEP